MVKNVVNTSNNRVVNKGDLPINLGVTYFSGPGDLGYDLLDEEYERLDLITEVMAYGVQDAGESEDEYGLYIGIRLGHTQLGYVSINLTEENLLAALANIQHVKERWPKQKKVVPEPEPVEEPEWVQDNLNGWKISSVPSEYTITFKAGDAG